MKDHVDMLQSQCYYHIIITYLCNDIIPEQYDINSYGDSNNMIIRRNSPGILKDIIADHSNSYDASYVEILAIIFLSTIIEYILYNSMRPTM